MSHGNNLSCVIVGRMSGELTQKQQHERAVFDRFATAAKLAVTPGSIESRDSPDIICELVGEGMVAFELTRLADTQFMKTIRECQLRGELLRGYARHVSPELKERFEGRHRDSDIHVHFQPRVTRREIQAILPSLLMELAAMPRGWQGEKRYAPPGLGAVVYSVRVARIRDCSEGPFLMTSAAEWFGNPLDDAVRTKIADATSYAIDCPLELVAYIDQQPAPVELWDTDLQQINELRAASRFRRVWIFDTWSGRLTSTPPPRAAA